MRAAGVKKPFRTGLGARKGVGAAARLARAVGVPGEVAHPERLRTESVAFESDGARLDAYLARPAEPGPAPAIVVVHEIFGLVEHVRDVTRRFANVGYDALAPDLYARTGAPPPTDLDAARAKGQALSDEQVVRDLAQAAAYVRGLDGATGKVGLIGFCSGGRQTLLTACSSDAFDAAVDCWGGFVHRASADAETTRQRPRKPLDLVPGLRCPLYAVFGADDQNPSPEIAQELERRLATAAAPDMVEVFENAGHAFFADYRQTYVEQAAFALWPKVLAFLEAHLR
jgi:carboxymethylenebutenolidase